jgi:hypothetical protein
VESVSLGYNGSRDGVSLKSTSMQNVSTKIGMWTRIGMTQGS